MIWVCYRNCCKERWRSAHCCSHRCSLMIFWAAQSSSEVFLKIVSLVQHLFEVYGLCSSTTLLGTDIVRHRQTWGEGVSKAIQPSNKQIWWSILAAESLLQFSHCVFSVTLWNERNTILTVLTYIGNVTWTQNISFEVYYFANRHCYRILSFQQSLIFDG